MYSGNNLFFGEFDKIHTFQGVFTVKLKIADAFAGILSIRPTHVQMSVLVRLVLMARPAFIVVA